MSRDSNISNSKRIEFKQKRRKLEFQLITKMLTPLLHKESIGNIRILEFGSGPAGGIEYLSPIGHLVITDIHEHPLLNIPYNVKFKIADIHKTDFKNHEFDLLVSNQVIEHLENLEVAFSEMKRIAKPDAYFVFGVPTATWLVLTVPGQLFKKIENLRSRLSKIISSHAQHRNNASQNIDCKKQENSIKKNKFALGGHGCYPGFIECYKAFKIKSWRKKLISNGFTIIKSEPLLSYGSSHLPIIPTNRILAKLGLSSSYCFICQKSIQSVVGVM